MIPLGQSENHTLEFKSREALRSLTPIGKAVAAMLNADGGEIWIGLRESAGRAIEIESIPNAALEKERLWDHILDTIEPRPRPEEFSIEVMEQDAQTILLVSVAKGSRRPYAYLRDGAQYLVRAGPRTRAMTREELRQHFAGAQKEASNAFEHALDEREKLRGSRQRPSIWIHLQPEKELELNLSSARLKQLLTDPEESGNRTSGWTVMNRFAKVGTRPGVLFSNNQESETRIHRGGAIEYESSLDRLWHGEAPRQIYPYAFCELTVSLLRLGAKVYEESGHSEGQVIADLAFLASAGWFIRSRSPKAYGYLFEGHQHDFPLPEEFFLDRPMSFGLGDLIREPDWCAFRLIQRTYENFGFPDDEVPTEFDRKTRRFVLG